MFICTQKDHTLIVVIGKEDDEAIDFANFLVKEEYARVVLLNGGIEALVMDAKGLLVGYGSHM